MIRRYKGERETGVLLWSEASTPLHYENTYTGIYIRSKRVSVCCGSECIRSAITVSRCVRHGMSFDELRLSHGHGSEKIMHRYLHLAAGYDARVLRMTRITTGPVISSIGIAPNAGIR